MKFVCLFAASLTATAAVAASIQKDPVQVNDPAMLQIVAADAQFELLAEGFRWAEGPVVEPKTGAVLFSDVPQNTVWRWQPGKGASPYLQPSGYSQLNQEENLGEGSNGLIFNQQGQLVLAQHGDRRLALFNGIKDGKPGYQTLVTAYQGKALNSPNDLVQHSSGAYYFTDPPYGLKNADQSAQKQLSFNGVYRFEPGKPLQLLTDKLTRPNGLAFSPDQQFLYVANSDPQAAQWWRYPVKPDGTLGAAELFFDATDKVATEAGLPDGLKVLKSGHLLATGPGGVWLFDAKAHHLGTIRTGVAAANVALSPDQQWLYVTASSTLLRIRLKAPSV